MLPQQVTCKHSGLGQALFDEASHCRNPLPLPVLTYVSYDRSLTLVGTRMVVIQTFAQIRYAFSERPV